MMCPLPLDVAQRLVEHLQPNGPTVDEVLRWPEDLQHLVLCESRVSDGGPRRVHIPPDELAGRAAAVRAEGLRADLEAKRHREADYQERCRERYRRDNRAAMRRWRDGSRAAGRRPV